MFPIPVDAGGQKGFTYVELIVVLSIFATLTSVVLFNYGTFQEKINLRIIGTEVALRIVAAQKSAVAGSIPPQAPGASWRPSYGIYFNSVGSQGGADSSDFIYFADLNNDGAYGDLSCALPPAPGGGECLDRISINSGYKISLLKVFYQDGTSQTLGDLNTTFTRPDSGATFASLMTPITKTVSYVEITMSPASGNQNSSSSTVEVYPSGRIQLK